ncbi:hypothetical protein SteCoe_9858 [Stentor coeruleus]|uniref:Uncharacterized protein n=1 Tax=Stentor coeruleus TaxID=5963 RepID=A0A1R2CGZ2_9CILI|nr:hypothetical protein SteCoe_9858 [Stentor coeruleus]
MRVNNFREFDNDFIQKIKPKQIQIDKEQLYQENLELKLKTHSLTQEVLRLKTKNMQIENELNRKEESKDIKYTYEKPQSTTLIPNLKKKIKDLKNELGQSEKEIHRLKSNIKCSKTTELEAEVQAYIDECTRLRHHLEETLKAKQEPTEEEIMTSHVLTSLRTENSELKKQLSTTKNDISALQKSLDEEKKKKRPIVKKIDVNKRTEIQKLRFALDKANKDFQEKEEKYQTDIALLNAKLEQKSIKSQTSKTTAAPKPMPTQNKSNENSESSKYKPSKSGPIANLFITKTKIKTIQKSQVADLLLRSSLSLQIHRIPKESFSNLINCQEPISHTYLKGFFSNDPFGFDSTESSILSQYLIDPYDNEVEELITSASLAHITEKFTSNTDDWMILTSADEENLDKELTDIVSEYNIILKEACLNADPERKGLIPIEKYQSILNDLQITLSPELENYCKLLFFSCNMQINVVPYEFFLKSYTAKDDENSDMDDEEIAKIVRGYLERIADRMIENRSSVKDVFSYDDEGVISAENFVEGIEELGIYDIPQGHMVLILEALQYENSENSCVLVEELEEILQHYGVEGYKDSAPTQEKDNEESEYSDDYEN